MSNMDFKTPEFLKPIEKILPKTLYQAIPALIQIGILGVVFLFFNIWYRALTEIDPYSFNQSVLATEPTQYFKGSLWLALPGLALVFLLLWKRNLVLVEWKRFQGGNSLRLIVGICAGLLAWAHATYPFNYFLDEYFFLERSLIVILAVLVIWRPVFILPYLLYPVLVHFGEPVLVNHWSITELPIRVLVLFCVQFLLWMAYGKSRWQIEAFVFLLFCILAGNYFPAGLGKLKLGWVTQNHIYLLLPNFYADGWLGFLSKEVLSEITTFLSKYNLLLKIGTLIFEAGCILILFGKTKTIRFFLIGFLLFHTLVFMMTGIFFWPWMIFELTLLFIFWKKEWLIAVVNKFTPWHLLLSIFLIGTSSRWLRPSVYVWHDSPINYTYSFEVEDVLGNKSDLPSHFFWPKYYEYAWSNGFHFIHENPTVGVNWGVSLEADVVNALLKLKDHDEVLALEEEFGTSRFDPELSAEFERYMIRFAREKKYKLTMNPWFRRFSAPPQRIIFPATTNSTYDGKNDISKIGVYQKLSFFDGENYREIRKRKVYTIDIPKNQ